MFHGGPVPGLSRPASADLSSVSARFEVSTFSGRIDNDFGPDGERTSRFAPGRALEHTTRDGSARISIETFSGNVFLRGD